MRLERPAEFEHENDSIIGASQALYKIKKWEWIVPKKFSEQLSS